MWHRKNFPSDSQQPMPENNGTGHTRDSWRNSTQNCGPKQARRWLVYKTVFSIDMVPKTVAEVSVWPTKKGQLGACTCVTMSVHLCLGSVRCAVKVHVSPSESVSSGSRTQHKQQCVAAHGGCRLGLVHKRVGNGRCLGSCRPVSFASKDRLGPRSLLHMLSLAVASSAKHVSGEHAPFLKLQRFGWHQRLGENGSTRATNAQLKQGVPKFLLHLPSHWSSSKSHACSMTSRSPFHSPGCWRDMPLSLRT